MINCTGFVIAICLIFLHLPFVTATWNMVKSITYSNDLWEANFSPDGNYIVFASNDGNNCIYDAWAYTNDFCHNDGDVADTAKFSIDQNYVAFGLRSGKVKIYDATNHPSYTQVTAISTGYGAV